MSPELDRILCERYPQIFRFRSLSPTEHSMGRGFAVGGRWFSLVEAACGVISSRYLSAEREYRHARQRQVDGDPEVDEFVVEHARRKMLAEQARLPVALRVKEKFGTLRFFLEGGGERTRACAEFAEYLSASICEVCGQPGVTLASGGWMRTRCEEHAGD